MSPELDKKLCEDFSEIFRDRHGDKTRTVMSWGFSCGDGWEPLIRATCTQIMTPVVRTRNTIAEIKDILAKKTTKMEKWEREHYTEDKLNEAIDQLALLEKDIPVAVQVKEKFGGLRFYVHGGTDVHHEIINYAERMSYYICETCSTMAGVESYPLGWVRTLCIQHADEQYGAEAAEYRKSKNSDSITSL